MMPLMLRLLVVALAASVAAAKLGQKLGQGVLQHSGGKTQVLDKAAAQRVISNVLDALLDVDKACFCKEGITRNSGRNGLMDEWVAADYSMDHEGIGCDELWSAVVKTAGTAGFGVFTEDAAQWEAQLSGADPAVRALLEKFGKLGAAVVANEPFNRMNPPALATCTTVTLLNGGFDEPGSLAARVQMMSSQEWIAFIEQKFGDPNKATEKQKQKCYRMMGNNMLKAMQTMPCFTEDRFPASINLAEQKKWIKKGAIQGPFTWGDHQGVTSSINVPADAKGCARLWSWFSKSDMCEKAGIQIDPENSASWGTPDAFVQSSKLAGNLFKFAKLAVASGKAGEAEDIALSMGIDMLMDGGLAAGSGIAVRAPMLQPGSDWLKFIASCVKAAP